MSEDYIAEKVGMGQVFTLEDGSYLTYSKHIIMCLLLHLQQKHRSFLQIRLGQRQLRILLAYPSDYEGRNYFGQVVKRSVIKLYSDWKWNTAPGNRNRCGCDRTNLASIWNKRENEGILGIYRLKPAADTSEYKTELYYPGDADIVKFNDTYNWSGKELYANKNGALMNDTEYLDNQSWDIAGTKLHSVMCM